MGPNKFDSSLAFYTLKHCRNVVAYMTVDEKKQFIKSKVEENVQTIHTNGIKEERIDVDYKIGSLTQGENVTQVSVCRGAFLQAYNISDWMLRQIVNNIKCGYTCTAPNYTDKSNVANETVVRMINEADFAGQPLSTEQLINMKVPNGPKSLVVSYDFDWVFNVMYLFVDIRKYLQRPRHG